MKRKWEARFGNPRVDVVTTITVEATSEKVARILARSEARLLKVPEKLTRIVEVRT